LGYCFAIERLIQVTNGAAQPGEETAIFLKMNEGQLYAGGNFWIDYNPQALSIVDVQKTALTTDFILTKGFPKPGRLSIAMASTEGLAAAANADLAIIKIQVLAGAPANSLLSMTFVDAYWFDENSVRHTYLGDNGLVFAGNTVPSETPLQLQVGSDEAEAGTTAALSMTLSLAEGASSVRGTLHFDPSLLLNPTLSLAGDLPGWQESHSVSNERLTFALSGTANLAGTGERILAECEFDVSSSAGAGTHIAVELEQPAVANVNDFGFYVEPVHGEILIADPTAQPTATPTPRTNSLADFNTDGQVDERDLMEFVSTWHQEGDTK